MHAAWKLLQLIDKLAGQGPIESIDVEQEAKEATLLIQRK
jgi:hypothetical protein